MMLVSCIAIAFCLDRRVPLLRQYTPATRNAPATNRPAASQACRLKLSDKLARMMQHAGVMCGLFVFSVPAVSQYVHGSLLRRQK